MCVLRHEFTRIYKLVEFVEQDEDAKKRKRDNGALIFFFSVFISNKDFISNLENYTKNAQENYKLR